jgi:uncharacterized protein DUF3999
MRTLAAIAAAAALLAAPGGPDAAAATPGDFALRLPLATERPDGPHRVELDASVLVAGMAPGLRDLRIFNAAGEALPLAMVPEPPLPAPALGAAIEVPLLPLSAEPARRADQLSRIRVGLAQEPGRETITIEPAVAPASPGDAPGGYLLDLRGLKDRSGRLTLHFADGAADFAARITLEGSDDLVGWRPLTTGTLARNRHLAQPVERGDFDLARPPAFARISWPATSATPAPPVPPALAQATFAEWIIAAAPARPDVPLLTVADSWRDGSGERHGWVTDVPPGLSLTRITIRPGRRNEVLWLDVDWETGVEAASRFDHRSLRDRGAGWLPYARHVPTHRVERDDDAGARLPGIGPLHPRRLRISVVDPAGYDGPPPQLDAGWKPVRIVFLARGPGPYELAIGRAESEAGPQLDPAVVPRDDPTAESLPVATVTETAAAVSTATQAAAAARAAQGVRSAQQQRWGLWAVLAAAIAVLAAMAWRLGQQLRARR